MMADSNPDAYRTLVLNADDQAGLCVVRSLGKRGVPVTAASGVERSLGALSRYSEDALVYQSPTKEPDAFIDRLVSVLEDRDYFALVPINDPTAKVVSQRKERLAATGTTIGVPDWEQARLVFDKALTFDIAESLSVPTPETHAPTGIDDVERFADDISYPVVVKPRSKYVQDSAGRLHLHRVGDDSYAESPAELRSTYRQAVAKNDHFDSVPPIVQEYVAGETTTTVGLADDGEFRAWFQERRLRTTPHSGGNSTVIRGMRDPRMREHAAEVIDALSWTGPVQVEFMRTPDDEYYLIEVNGRYWGSVPLAVDSGVDIPWLHLCQLAGHPPTTPPVYRDDVVHQRLLFGDFKWLFERLSTGHPQAALKFLAAFLYATPVFARADDPLPTIAAPFTWARFSAPELYERATEAWSTESDDSSEGAAVSPQATSESEETL